MNKILLLFLIVSLLYLGRNIAQAQLPSSGDLKTDTPIVVELFTSQSCSSCPSADKILNELSTNTNIITLGCHVTYWNHLSWVDDLSHEFCTQRQRNYAAQMNAKRIYTPQIVVNGRYEFTGSDRGALKKAIRKAPPIKPIHITTSDNEKLNIKLPEIQNGQYMLTLFGTLPPQMRKIHRGENSGKTINYTDAVNLIYDAGDWEGKASTRTLAAPKKGNNYVILAQDKSTGEIYAAGILNKN